MAEETIRLGGMALPNGVLVHGPRAWACAVRDGDGRLQVASDLKRFVANDIKVPLLSGLLSFAPATLALRSSELAAYHGAEHIAIGTYEHGERRAKEHERCGSHLIGPLLATSAVGNALAGRAPERWRGPARAVAQLGALGASTEIFGW